MISLGKSEGGSPKGAIPPGAGRERKTGGKTMLSIHKTIADGRAVFVLSGRLDTVTSPQLDRELRTSLEGVTELILDMKDLVYLSSAGLRVLLVTQRTMAEQGEMKVIHANEIVMEIFEVTGFLNILTVEGAEP